jgi:UDP-glucose 4-epimerase
MKSLVTGGAGFIGSHLVEKLVLLGHKVIVIDNFSIGRISNLKNVKNKIKIINADVTQIEKIENLFKGVENVYHLAALADIVPSIEEPSKYFRVNVNGTLNVLECSIKYGIKKFIYSASSSCYGIPKKYPTSEGSLIDPKYPYALTKRMGEELVIHYSNIYDLNITSLRFFNVYGPRARTSGTYGAVFGVFLAQKFANKSLTIVGSGRQKRDFTFVSDVIDAIIKITKCKNAKGQYLNVGSGQAVSVNKIAKLIGGSKIKIPKRPGEPNVTFADISKIRKLTGWFPKVGIEEGIKLMMNDSKDWSRAPVWTPKKIKEATKKWFLYLGK